MKNYPRLYGLPITEPEHMRPLLRDPDLHWKQGRSAFETSHAWVKADGLPKSVRSLLAAIPEWSEGEIVAGFFEHATALDTQAGPSSTDLLVVCGLREGLGVLAVEGKAGETFGPKVSEWLALAKPNSGRPARLKWACDLFGVTQDAALDLRWQLFHRTASAALEAKRFRARHAIMLVHDFSAAASGSDDFVNFAVALGAMGAGVGKVSAPFSVQGASVRLAWLQDKVWPTKTPAAATDA